jgi:hypothetical protein
MINFRTSTHLQSAHFFVRPEPFRTLSVVGIPRPEEPSPQPPRPELPPLGPADPELPKPDQPPLPEIPDPAPGFPDAPVFA